tara:strand:+ start:2813 stop:3763 length:951 start_codon:yes stop_codon:yes gene_type:complete
MAALSIGKPVVIDGQEVIIVRDVVNRNQANSKDSDYYALVEGTGTAGQPEIYVAESDIARLRENYPGMNVYGLWQVLFHNRAVTMGSQVIIYPITEKSGMYLTLETGSDYTQVSNIVASGEYADNYIVDFVEFDLKNAYRIDTPLTELKLPAYPAYKRTELGEMKRAEANRKWIVTGSFCGLLVVAALAANYFLSTIYKSQVADYATKIGLINELEDRVAVLSSERLITRPDDSAELEIIFSVFELYPDAWTPTLENGSSVGFRGEHLLITPTDAPVDPKTVIAGVKTELQPDLSYKVHVEASAEITDEAISGALF